MEAHVPPAERLPNEEVKTALPQREHYLVQIVATAVDDVPSKLLLMHYHVRRSLP